MLPRILLVGVGAASSTQYEPNWESLMTRPLPDWYDDAKVGIFMHWGVYSVPALVGTRTQKGFTPAEWYWNRLKQGDPETTAFHNKTYGPNFPYQNFVPDFTATFFDPNEWAAMFKDAGIKYVVLTSKHHDGFTLWCSPESYSWNSCDAGPQRNIVAELTDSVRSVGLRMGLYYSLYEWFHPLYLQDKASGGDAGHGYNTSRYVDEVMYPQWVELNKAYQPDLLWADGQFEAPSSYWRSQELLAWLYNNGAGTADSLVVNDRWGVETYRRFGGYFSGVDRQQADPSMLNHKWESAFTLDASSWGYARNSPLSAYLNISFTLYEVVSAVAYGGNALINVGPTADGQIPTIFRERLGQLGAWLRINGDAIYGSTKWYAQNDTEAHGCEYGVYYTAAKQKSPNAGAVYAFAMAWPEDNKLRLTQPVVANGINATARMLGCNQPMAIAPAAAGEQGLVVTIPALSPKELPSYEGPWVFELHGVQWVGHTMAV